MSVTIPGGIAGAVVSGLTTFTNGSLVINANDVLVVFFAAIGSAATSTVTNVTDNSGSNTWSSACTALADGVIDGSHHGSGSMWICNNAAAASASSLTITATISGANWIGLQLISARGCNNTTPIANSGAAATMGSANGSGANPMPFTTPSVTDTTTTDQAVGFAGAWANTQTDNGVAGSGCTKIVGGSASFNGANMCSCYLNAGSVNGSTNNVTGSVANGAGVDGQVLGTIVFANGGGTLHTSSLSGGESFVGALPIQINKLLIA